MNRKNREMNSLDKVTPSISLLQKMSTPTWIKKPTTAVRRKRRRKRKKKDFGRPFAAALKLKTMDSRRFAASSGQKCDNGSAVAA